MPDGHVPASFGELKFRRPLTYSPWYIRIDNTGWDCRFSLHWLLNPEQTGILHTRQLFERAPRRLVTVRLRSGLRLTGSIALRLVGARMTNREYGCVFCHSRAWLPREECPIPLPPVQKSTVEGRLQSRPDIGWKPAPPKIPKPACNATASR